MRTPGLDHPRGEVTIVPKGAQTQSQATVGDWLAPVGFLAGWTFWVLPTGWALLNGIHPVEAILASGSADGGGPHAKLAWFVAGLIPIATAYPGLPRALPRLSPHQRLAFYGLYAGLAVVSLPLLSHDMLSFMAEARLVDHYQLNPMLTPIDRVPGWRHDPWLRQAGWVHQPNPYGPCWFWWMALVGTIAPPFWPQFLVMKAANLLAAAVTARFLARRWGRAAAISFGCHPLVGIELLANGQNDAWMVALMVVGYDQYLRKRYARFGMAWSLAVGIKFVPLVLLPILIMALRTEAAATTLGVGILVLAAAYAPFWRGAEVLAVPLVNQGLFLRSLDFVIQGVFSHFWIHRRAENRSWSVDLGTLGFLAIGWHRARMWLRTADPRWLGDTFLALALIGLSWFQYWYLIWALPFYLISPGHRARRMVLWLAWCELARGWAWAVPLTMTNREIVQVAWIWMTLLASLAWPLDWRSSISARVSRGAGNKK